MIKEVLEAVYELLTSDSGVTDIVGTRIYNTQAEIKADFPYIVFGHLTSAESESTFQSMDAIRQMTVYLNLVDSDTSPFVLTQLYDAVHSALQDAPLSMASYTCLKCKEESVMEIDIEKSYGERSDDRTRLLQTSLRYRIWVT